VTRATLNSATSVCILPSEHIEAITSRAHLGRKGPCRTNGRAFFMHAEPHALGASLMPERTPSNRQRSKGLSVRVCPRHQPILQPQVRAVHRATAFPRSGASDCCCALLIRIGRNSRAPACPRWPRNHKTVVSVSIVYKKVFMCTVQRRWAHFHNCRRNKGLRRFARQESRLARRLYFFVSKLASGLAFVSGWMTLTMA
jgi:hypothetical protein